VNKLELLKEVLAEENFIDEEEAKEVKFEELMKKDEIVSLNDYSYLGKPKSKLDYHSRKQDSLSNEWSVPRGENNENQQNLMNVKKKKIRKKKVKRVLTAEDIYLREALIALL